MTVIMLMETVAALVQVVAAAIAAVIAAAKTVTPGRNLYNTATMAHTAPRTKSLDRR